jgi:hypothetical protein
MNDRSLRAGESASTRIMGWNEGHDKTILRSERVPGSDVYPIRWLTALDCEKDPPLLLRFKDKSKLIRSATIQKPDLPRMFALDSLGNDESLPVEAS